MKNNSTADLRTDERGLVTIAIVTLVLTALIGGAGLLSMVTTRQPISGPLDRLDSGEATPEDMDALQNAGRDMERTARIAAGAGSFIGGGGPVPNPAAPGMVFPGDKAAAGIIPRVISRLTNRASQPAQTGDNPLPPSVSAGGPKGPDTGGYDPTRDPGMGSGSGQAVDPNIGNTFQGQVPGGGGKPTVGDGGQPIAQPPGYTSPTQPPGGPTDTTTGPPVIWPTGKCPPGYHPSYDGSCRPSRGLLPPPRPDGHSSSGGSKPGTSGECPPGCHLKPDGSGQCHCGEEAGGTKPPATTTPPPAKPPTTSRPTGGAGG